MGLLIFLFALAGMVWLVPVLRAGRMMPLLTICMIAGVVSGPSFFAIDGPIQISLDRMMLVGVVGVLLIRMRMGQMHWAALTRTDALIAFLVGYFLLSCMRGGAVPDGSSPVARWLFFVAAPATFYAIGRQIRLTEADLRLFQNTMLVLGFYLSLTAVFEVMGLRQFVFPRYINDPKSWEFFGRGRGPLLNPVANGMLITLSLTLAAVRLFQRPWQEKVFYAGLILLMSAGTYASLTRSVWLGAIAALGVVALVHTPRWVRVLGLAVAVLLAGGMAMGLKDQLLSIKRDKNLSAVEAAKSIELRPLLATVAWEMFKDKPLVGHGYGHYFEHAPPYHTIRSHGLPLERVRPYMQHNVFLSILVDTGLTGLAAFGLILSMIAAMAWRLARDPLTLSTTRATGLAMLGFLAGYVINGMFHEVAVMEMVNVFLLSLSGLTVAAYQYGVKEHDERAFNELALVSGRPVCYRPA